MIRRGYSSPLIESFRGKISNVLPSFFCCFLFRVHLFNEVFFLAPMVPFFFPCLCPSRGQKENVISPACVISTTLWALASKRDRRSVSSPPPFLPPFSLPPPAVPVVLLAVPFSPLSPFSSLCRQLLFSPLLPCSSLPSSSSLSMTRSAESLAANASCRGGRLLFQHAGLRSCLKRNHR